MPKVTAYTLAWSPTTQAYELYPHKHAACAIILIEPAGPINKRFAVRFAAIKHMLISTPP